MRKALVVGVNWYADGNSLRGCVRDSFDVKAALERNSDGTINFDVRHVTALSADEAVSAKALKTMVRELFADDGEVALFYFAGHGAIDSVGGYIFASDDEMSLHEVIALANASKARNRIVILDSCHSGVAGANSASQKISEVGEGVTILTASTDEQSASEEGGNGVFTNLLVDALNGSAANLVGDITPGSVYAHIDQSLGPWQQRPVFKTNVKTFVSLRRVVAPIELGDLRKIAALFPVPGFQYSLDASFEPELAGRPNDAPPPSAENVAIFRLLQKYNRLNLLVPVDAPHMWHAAIEGKACRLTVLGEHYRNLAEKNRI